MFDHSLNVGSRTGTPSGSSELICAIRDFQLNSFINAFPDRYKIIGTYILLYIRTDTRYV